jgi:hypothetical protein
LVGIGAWDLATKKAGMEVMIYIVFANAHERMRPKSLIWREWDRCVAVQQNIYKS